MSIFKFLLNKILVKLFNNEYKGILGYLKPIGLILSISIISTILICYKSTFFNVTIFLIDLFLLSLICYITTKKNNYVIKSLFFKKGLNHLINLFFETQLVYLFSIYPMIFFFRLFTIKPNLFFSAIIPFIIMIIILIMEYPILIKQYLKSSIHIKIKKIFNNINVNIEFILYYFILTLIFCIIFSIVFAIIITLPIILLSSYSILQSFLIFYIFNLFILSVIVFLSKCNDFKLSFNNKFLYF